MATNVYNANMSPYLQAKLSGVADSYATTPTPATQDQGNSLGGFGSALGTTVLGLGVLKGGSKGLGMARSAWTGRNATPEQALADSGNTLDTAVSGPEAQSWAAKTAGGDMLGSNPILDSKVTDTGQTLVKIMGKNGETWLPAGPNNITTSSSNPISTPGAEINPGAMPGYGQVIDPATGAPISGDVANEIAGGWKAGQGGADLAGELAGGGAKAAGSALAGDAASLTLGGVLKAALGPAAIAMIAGGDAGNVTAQDKFYRNGSPMNPADAMKVLTANMAVANQPGLSADDKKAILGQVAGMSDAYTKMYGQSIPLSAIPASFRSLISSVNSSAAKAQANSPTSFGGAVDSVTQNLANQLSSNGIDPNGQLAQGIYQDLSTAATKISKTSGTDHQGALQQYADTLYQNVNKYAQQQAYQRSYPQAAQTAYAKMSVDIIKPYLDSMQAQSEQSAGQLLQLATAAAHRGDKAVASQLMAHAQAIRQDSQDQALQAITLAANTPRMMAYENQMKALNANIAQQNAKTGSSNSLTDVLAQQGGL